MSAPDMPPGPRSETEVVPYRESFRDHFARLNLQWIEQYFREVGQEAGYERADIEMVLTLRPAQ